MSLIGAIAPHTRCAASRPGQHSFHLTGALHRVNHRLVAQKFGQAGDVAFTRVILPNSMRPNVRWSYWSALQKSK